MPAYARKDIVRVGEIGTYHCWSRCVQRAFLCGADPVTGNDFDYRRGWIEDLLVYQARVFAVDVGNFSVLSNHLHAILRTRPDLAARWSAEELALRWKLAWPQMLDGQWVREPTDQELDELLTQPATIERIRRNLSSLSWFMARWKEPIARLCNAETETSGHFWESRFQCRELLDDEAVLTCSIYVDLNQLRAGMAESLAQSRHSAICQRILAAKAREAQASWEDVGERNPARSAEFALSQAADLFADCALAPIAAQGPLLTTDSLPAGPEFSGAESGDGEGSVAPSLAPEHASTAAPGPVSTTCAKASRTRPQLTRRRASDSPFVAVAWAEYLRVVQALAGRSVTRGAVAPVGGKVDSGATDEAALRATLARWGMNPDVWLAKLHCLDRQCARVLGTAQRVLQRAQDAAQQRFQGIRLCRELFAADTPDAFT